MQLLKEFKIIIFKIIILNIIMSDLVCKICDKNFSTKYTLLRHSQKKIPCMTIKKNFQCDKCDKIFCYKSGLSRHKYSCQLIKKKCNKIFTIENFEKLLQANTELINQVKNSSYNKTIINNNFYNKCNIIMSCFKDAPNFSTKKIISEKQQLDNYIISSGVENDSLQNSIQDGIVNLIKNNFIENVSEKERAIWCIDNKEKTFMVRNMDKWTKDIQGVEYACPELDHLKGMICNFIILKIYELELKKFDIDDKILSGEFEDNYDTRGKYTKEIKNLKYFNEVVKKKNFSKKVLYKLIPDIMFDINNNNIEDLEKKMLEIS